MIPWDKSWIIRLGVLDILNGRDHITDFLRREAANLSDDLKSLARAVLDWKNEKQYVYVGESGSLYRFLQFASWRWTHRKRFVKCGTLKGRKICYNPRIVEYTPAQLLKLDGGTSQWASAQYLCTSQGPIDNPPHKLRMSYEAYHHWTENEPWQPRRDATIARQLHAYLDVLETGTCAFAPEHSEDYCFARAFGLITAQEGERRWPSLRHHESDRICAMEEAIAASDDQRAVDSKDHRVVQAIAMRQAIRGDTCDNITHPEAVNKSWPQFWRVVGDDSSID